MTGPAKIRVLIVDDSLVMRRIIQESLSHDPDIQVVGTASGGRSACEKVQELHPDLVTMDVEMPGMGGIEALREVRLRDPKLPVIMVSSLTRKGATTVLEALGAGANDYVTKPQEAGEALAAVQSIGRDLIPKIKALCSVQRATALRQSRPVPPTPLSPAGVPSLADHLPQFAKPIEILCIGSSTGGPNALSDFFKGLPANLPVPIVLVQHMPPMFTQILAERLHKETLRPCCEAAEGMEIQAGSAYVAPGGKHLEVRRLQGRTFLHLQDGPPEHSCRPAVDVLFRSVVQHFGAATLGVVMTGMGRDGAASAQLIRQAGGQVLAQDQETSVVWGMPGAVVEVGAASTVLPLLELAPAAARWIQQSRRT